MASPPAIGLGSYWSLLMRNSPYQLAHRHVGFYNVMVRLDLIKGRIF